ncbi:hypothetical protein M513_03167, partial [Trichuris suis]
CVDVTSKKHLAFCPKYNFFRGRCRPSQTFLLLYRLDLRNTIDPQTVQSSNHLLAAQQINNHPVAEHLWGRLTNMHCPLECDQIIWSTRYSLLYVFSATRHFSYQEPDAAFRSTFAYGQYGNLDRYDRKRIYFLA